MEPTCENCSLAFGMKKTASVRDCSALQQLRHQMEHGGSIIDANGNRITCPLDEDTLGRYAKRTKDLIQSRCPIEADVINEVDRIVGDCAA